MQQDEQSVPEINPNIAPHEDYFGNLKDASYRGNQNLKDGVQSVNVPVDTFAYYANEIIKCKNDIVYFANTYYHIISGKRGKHVIDTYPKQNDLLESMQNNERLVVLASRQTGKCVSGETIISLRDNATGEEFDMPIEQFYKKLQNENE